MPAKPKRTPAKKTAKSSTNKYLEFGGTVISLLQREDVRRQVVDASEGLRNWADSRRQQRDSTGTRIDPLGAVTSRIGHQRVERRISELFAVVPEFDTVRPELAAELRATETDLKRAVTVTSQLSATKRMQARRDIYKRLDVIEQRLIDAILGQEDRPPEPTNE